ncbi:MAG TPA: hypothetical protein VFF43_20225, partial [Caldimonas sp.]|nr:hypothetical protein [Caldimonas sp.]
FLFAYVVAAWNSWTRGARLAAASFPWIAGYIEVRGWTGFVGRLASSYCLAGGVLLAAAFALALLDRRPSAG